MAVAFPVSGAIDAKRFPFLVMELYHHGATGSLKVDGPSYQKDLYFRGGRILFGSSNDPRDQLGAILIEAGRLTPEQLEEVNAKVGPGNPLAKVLADSGLVTQQELTNAARLKVEQILGDIIGYDEGSFEFEDGVLPKGAVDLKLHTDRLVLGAARRITDRSFVLGHLGSLEVVLTPAAEASPEIKAAAGDLLTEIDGQCTLKEAIARTKLEEFDAAKVACALVFLGLLRRPDSATGPAPKPTTEDSPFFVSESAGTGLDLGATARMAMGEPGAAPAPVAPVPSMSTPASSAPLAFDEPEPEAPREPPRDSPPSVWQPPPPVSPAPALPVFQQEPPPPERPLFPHIEPPSQRDLAAINALLAAPVVADSPSRRAPAARRETPRFVPATRAQHAPAAEHGGHAMLWIAAALLLVVGAGGAGWWYLAGPGAGASGGRAALTPSPHATPLVSPPTLATPVTDPSAATPPQAPPTTPAPLRTPQPNVVATAAPLPAATPAPVTAATADGRTLLVQRRFSEAGRAFSAQARALRTRHTIQILVACSDETLDKTLESVGSEQWFIIPVVHKGRPCHRLCWGTYDTAAAADEAQRRLPEYFRSGGALPRVVPLASILP